MADFSALKTAIQTYIKQNGNEEITGEILQEILLSVVTTLGDGAINDLITALGNEVTARQQADGTLQQNITNEATARGNADTALQGLIDGITDNIENGYVYAGIATPSSTPTTGKVFYLALTAGTYTNFGSTVVSQGINILKYNGSAWSLDTFVGIDDTPTPNSPNMVKSGGAFDSVMTNGSAFDISAHFASGGTLATYADLDAALAALNTLSASYKRGGMSIKFVQSSDNKYIQARCMAQNFTTDVTQWQSVDDVPTAGSENIVKSGGVEKVRGTKPIFTYTERTGGYWNANEQWETNTEDTYAKRTNIKACAEGQKYYYKGVGQYNAISVIFYNGDSIVSSQKYNSPNSYTEITIPSGCNGVAFFSYGIGSVVLDVLTDVQYKANVATEINEIQNTDIEAFKEVLLTDIELPYQENIGSISPNGVITPASEGNYRYSSYIEIEGGKQYYITASTNWGNYLYAFYDSSKSLISGQKAVASGTNTELIDEPVTAPSNAKYIIVCYFITNPNKGKVVTEMYSVIDKSIENNFINAYIPQRITVRTARSINADGTVSDDLGTAAKNFRVCENFSVKEGDVLYLTACAFWSNCLYAIYDSQDNVLEKKQCSTGSGTFEYIYDYKVVMPADADHIVIAWANNKLSEGYIKTLERKVKSPFLDKVWACVGDSLTDNLNSVEPLNRYYNYISEETGIAYQMFGVGGTGYAKGANDGQAFYQRVTNVKTDADIITLFGSFNDLSSGIPLGTTSDTGTTTICGCIYQTLNVLYTTNPIANIGIISPTPWGDYNPVSPNSDAEAYINALKSMAEKFSIPFLDLYHNSGLRPWNADARALTYNQGGEDSVHPNSKGHEIIATKIREFIKQLL